MHHEYRAVGRYAQVLIATGSLSLAPAVWCKSGEAIAIETASTTYALTVDATADTVALDGECSLREAVAIANRVFDPSNDCPLVTSSNPWDTIQFAAALGGTTLTVTSALSLNSPAFVTIQGPSPTLASSIKIDGNDATRLFDIAVGANVTLKYLTLQHGKTTGTSPDADGGGIRNAGALTLNSCALQINSTIGGNGGAVANTGFLTVLASTLSNNFAYSGAAIFSGNSLSISHGYIANNGAYIEGGGIDLRGTATITYTTIATNSAGANGGGGIFIAPGAALNMSTSMVGGNSTTGSGGGIESFAQFAVSNSTFNGNTATGFGGAVNNEIASATANTIAASTFAANSSAGGNAIAALQGGISLRHSLLAGSANCNGTITDSGANIAADASCGLGAGSLSMADPQLQILANYGGPTMTMPPAQTSPAIDVINAGDCDGAVDQRGISRPQGGKCDIGAVELQTDVIFPDGFESWP